MLRTILKPRGKGKISVPWFRVGGTAPCVSESDLED